MSHFISNFDLFLQIKISQFSFTPDSFWWQLGRDFIIPVFIAVLAAVLAYDIFVKETKRDKKSEKTRANQLRNDKLLYFSSLVHNVLQNSEEQNEHLYELIGSIKRDDINFQLMTQVPLYDHKRIVEIINLEDYLLSYANYFSIDRINAILEFQKIIAATDYLYSTFKNLIDIHLKAQTFDHERKIRFARLFESANTELQILFIFFSRLDNDYSKAFFQCYDTFIENVKGNSSDVTLYYSKFFKPYHEFLAKYILDKQQIRPDIMNLVMICKNALTLYAEMKDASKNLITDYKEEIGLINLSIENLQQESNRLLNTFLKE